MAEPVIIRPHRNYLAKLYLSTFLWAGIFVFPWICMALVPELGAIYAVVFVVANLVWLVPTLVLLPAYYRSISYELREQEIVVYKGIITRSTKIVPYRTITNLLLKRGPLDRWFFGIGTINVETAGHSGQTAPEATLVGLEDYEGVQALVRDQLRRFRGPMTTATEVEPAAAPTDATTAALLAEVRRIRELLESDGPR